MHSFEIRPILPRDNQAIANVIREVLLEFGVPKVGTAYADKALDCMYETYHKPRAIYFVIVYNNTVVGGGGIAQLDNYEGNVCELQKMYFLPQARGQGLGSLMIEKCLEKAKLFRYASCYLETMPYMEAAQKLYAHNGFSYIDGPMGNTGHFSCPVHMIKPL